MGDGRADHAGVWDAWQSRYHLHGLFYGYDGAGQAAGRKKDSLRRLMKRQAVKAFEIMTDYFYRAGALFRSKIDSHIAENRLPRSGR